MRRVGRRNPWGHQSVVWNQQQHQLPIRLEGSVILNSVYRLLQQWWFHLLLPLLQSRRNRELCHQRLDIEAMPRKYCYLTLRF